MAKINKRIEIVRSSITSLSSMGQKSCDMIQAVLEQHYETVGVSFVNNSYDLELLVRKQPDLVFLGVKNVPDSYSPNKTIWISEYLDGAGVNYTGSPAAAIALDFDKPLAKQVVKAAGLKTSAYFTAEPEQYKNTAELALSFPLFVKPPNGGGGKGIGADSVVRDFKSYQQKVQSIADKYHTNALVETYLPGREFSVAILQTADTVLAMPVELITEANEQGDRILGQKVKSADTEHVIAVPYGPVRKAVVTLAKQVFAALGARDYGRIDIRLDENNLPHFLEANLIPGLAQHDFTSYFTSACLIDQAMDYQTMILHIAELGLVHDSAVSSFDNIDPSLLPAFEVL